MVDVSMHSKIFVTMQIYGDFPGRKFHIWNVRGGMNQNFTFLMLFDFFMSMSEMFSLRKRAFGLRSPRTRVRAFCGQAWTQF